MANQIKEAIAATNKEREKETKNLEGAPSTNRNDQKQNRKKTVANKRWEIKNTAANKKAENRN